jgi:hypothetical protein
VGRCAACTDADREVFLRFDSLSYWLEGVGIEYVHDDIMSYHRVGTDEDWFSGDDMPAGLDPLVAFVIKAHADYYVSHYYPANER